MNVKDECDEFEKSKKRHMQILAHDELHVTICDLHERMEHIANVYGRWQDYINRGFPTTEHQIHALQDFGRAIEKAMDGYNSRERRKI
jgi:hypothetical protein